jgi:hypothetical protein
MSVIDSITMSAPPLCGIGRDSTLAFKKRKLVQILDKQITLSCTFHLTRQGVCLSFANTSLLRIALAIPKGAGSKRWRWAMARSVFWAPVVLIVASSSFAQIDSTSVLSFQSVVPRSPTSTIGTAQTQYTKHVGRRDEKHIVSSEVANSCARETGTPGCGGTWL